MSKPRSFTHGANVLTLMGTIVWLLRCANSHFSLGLSAFKMDLVDRIFTTNRDWDPAYLRYIFSQDFYEFHDLWASNMCDKELIKVVEKTESKRYTPIVEDILVNDDTLYAAVDQIEKE